MVMGWEITEAIRQQARSRIGEGDTCHHGGARGMSSWDTYLCSSCADEAALAEMMWDDERAEREALERGEPWPPEPEPEPVRVLTPDEVPF
jgi:hypothetical protein